MCNVESALCEKRTQILGLDHPLRCRLSRVRILSSIKSHVKSLTFVPKSQVESLLCHHMLLYNQFLLVKAKYAFFVKMNPNRSPLVQIRVLGLSINSMAEAIRDLQKLSHSTASVPNNPNTSLVFHYANTSHVLTIPLA
jgi:hypothetical protein